MQPESLVDDAIQLLHIQHGLDVEGARLAVQRGYNLLALKHATMVQYKANVWEPMAICSSDDNHALAWPAVAVRVPPL